jgi:hypothetical protein
MRGGETRGAAKCSVSHVIERILAMYVQGRLRGGVKEDFSHVSCRSTIVCLLIFLADDASFPLRRIDAALYPRARTPTLSGKLVRDLC